MIKTTWIYRIIGFIFFVAILLFSYRIDLHDEYSHYLDTHLISRGLKQNIENLKQDFAQKDSYSTAFTTTQTMFNQKMAVMPAIKNMNAALETVKNTAEKAQLKIAAFVPGAHYPKDFYIAVPAQITVVGSYQAILDFMQKTASGDGPFFIWDNWTLSHQNKPKTTVLNETQNNDLLQMHVNAIFFFTP